MIAVRGELEDALEPAHRGVRASDMLGKNGATARTKDALHLRDCFAVIRNAAERESGDDGVEAGVSELECLGITQPQIDGTSELPGSLPCLVEHGLAEVEAGQSDVVCVEGKVPSGSHGDLENVPVGLRAGPRTRIP